ncbi:MAG: pitrilysin family protein [Chloroflexi bacterium]|nr:pitrilysin family protein [Chloroflexota bacterium]
MVEAWEGSRVESSARLAISFREQRLRNGLRVIVSPDDSAPVVTVALYYNVGFRLEPRGRTGFAHLFEHLMFQGSEQMAKLEFIRIVQQTGGLLNGTTRPDFTNYFETLPSHALELALWMEADRMRGPVITQAELDNQRDVVKNEIRVNVLNRPYGGFPWIDLGARAYSNWANAHNGYGDMQDLDAATLEDVRDFFARYYAPANAVLVIVGDADAREALALAERHFSEIPSQAAPAEPDIAEPRRLREERFRMEDPLAHLPALALGYHVPERGTADFFALGLLDQVLLQGDDALLRRELVHERGLTDELHGGMNLLGNMFNGRTPMLWAPWLIHDREASVETVLGAIDAVVERVREHPLPADDFARAKLKARSALYETAAGGMFPGLGRADLLASAALIDGDTGWINGVEERLEDLTPGVVLATAREYLRSSNRAVLAVEAGAGPDASPDPPDATGAS